MWGMFVFEHTLLILKAKENACVGTERRLVQTQCLIENRQTEKGTKTTQGQRRTRPLIVCHNGYKDV